MIIQNAFIGLEVVRSKGDYVVGRTGRIIEIDNNKSRCRVEWTGNTTTWVSVAVIEPVSIPYIIQGGKSNKHGRPCYPVYRVL